MVKNYVPRNYWAGFDASRPRYFKELTKWHQLERYAERYYAESGNRVTVEYLFGCAKLVGYFIGDELVGAYGINLAKDQGLRVFSIFPKKKRSLLLSDEVQLEEVMEVACLFIVDQPFISNWDRMKLKWQLLHDTMAVAEERGARFLIAGSYEAGLQGDFRVVLSIPIYKDTYRGRRTEIFMGPVNTLFVRAMWAIMRRTVIRYKRHVRKKLIKLKRARR